MKQQELKDIKRQLLTILAGISEKYDGVPDEDADAVCRGLHITLCSIVNRIEVKYKKKDNG